MSIKRISTKALDSLLNGATSRPATCIVKFYSNDCHMCHNLKDIYEESADFYSQQGIDFYAFNIQDNPSIAATLGFEGVPTIVKIETQPPNANTTVINNPQKPTKTTFYRRSDIHKFIEGE